MSMPYRGHCEHLREGWCIACIAPRWTPTDEKPPEIGMRVLGFWMSHRGAVQSVRGAVGGWLDDDGNVTAPPTHWMPLPAPPTDAK